MTQIWIIAKRELSSFFDSLTAYILMVLFFGFTGLVTWMIGNSIFFVNQASMQVFFSWAYWALFLFIPALTMRTIAEENKSGTLELLLTKPVTDWQLVTGKFLSIMLLILISLALTLPYYFTLWKLGHVDHGGVWSGYLGLILMSAVYTSIGIFSSSLSQNQIVAFLLSLFISVFFHIIFGALSATSSGFIGNILNYLSMQTHFDSISRGVIDSRDLIYYFSLVFLGLAGAELVVARRNIID